MHFHRVNTTPSRSSALGLAPALGLVLGLWLAGTSQAGSGTSIRGSEPVSAQAKPQAKTITVFAGRSEHVTLPWQAKGASVTDPAVADINLLTPEILLVTGKAVGTTNVLAWSEGGQTLELKVEVNSDLSRLKVELAELFPRSSLQVTQSQSAVVLTGSLDRAEQADGIRRYLEAQKVNFVDLTSVAGVQQVQVQVRMAEVSRTAMRALGVNGIVAGSDAFGGTNIDGTNPSSILPVAGPFSGSLPLGVNSATTLSPAVTLFGGLTNGDLELFVRALAENKYLRILAEPNLVALSGSEASFLVGGEVPIPVSQGTGGAGSGGITVQFKPFGITLTFRPTVLGDNGIRLEVFSEVSEIDPSTGTSIGGITTPGFATRRAESTMEMKSGQSFAMAGLLSEKTTAISSRLPVLGNLPILGALFRSIQYQKGQTELLIIVTANLVEPVSDLNLPPVPGDEHIEPTDWELYIEGRSEGHVPARCPADEAAYMKKMGLDRLKGPGAWMSYGKPPATSTARSSQRGTPPPEPAPPDTATEAEQP